MSAVLAARAREREGSGRTLSSTGTASFASTALAPSAAPAPASSPASAASTAAPSSALRFLPLPLPSPPAPPVRFLSRLRRIPSSQNARFSRCRASLQVRMATTDRSRLYCWTGLRKTGAEPDCSDEEGGAANRIEVVDSL